MLMKNLYTLKKYFARYSGKLYFGLLCILLSNLGTVYIPLQIKDAVNGLGKNPDYNALNHYAMVIVISSLVAGLFRFLIRQTIIVVSREIEYDLRGDFWEHIQKLPLRYFQNNSTGNLMAHATNDINAVRMFIGPAVMYSIDTAIRFIIVIIIMMKISPGLTVYALIPLPFLSVLVYAVGKKVHTRFTQIQEKFSELTAKAQENFSGIRVIKSYCLEADEIERFGELSKDYLRKNMKLVKIQALFQPMLFLLTGLSVIIVIWGGAHKVMDGTLQLGDVTALIIYLGILIWPMIAFGWVINIIQQAEASMNRLNKIFAEKYEIDDRTETEPMSITGEITFKDVSFRYGPELPDVLKHINLTINRGETVAVMGKTGSGKSTFLNLLVRFYDVTGGEVLIDGKNIKEYPLSVLRTSVGYAQQEPFLFSETLANNLAYGLETFDEQRTLEAAAISQFEKDVVEFPLKYETIIGERGITLSGGQKQRASLARALATHPSILLLDDTFSAVDTHTEEEILIRLKEFMKDRTTILISHRVSTVKEADKILVLENGQIAESGTHESLLALNGLYADTYYKQLLEKELEQIPVIDERATEE